ncbi:MAG: radical SAM/SPASM domain-containing protein [Planctomycetota bacterium]
MTAAEIEGRPTFNAYPLKLHLDLTADCNLECPSCPFTPPRAWARKNDPTRILHVGLDTLTQFASEVFPHIHAVCPTIAGEPMMYPFWPEFVELCREYGVCIETYTNGTYLDEASLAPLAGVLNELIVSMDGASPETFDVLRKPAKLHDVVARLHLVREWRASLTEAIRPTVLINSTLSLPWVHELPAMVRLAADCGVDALVVGHVQSLNEYWRRQRPGLEPERTDAALVAAAAEARRLGIGLEAPRLFGSDENVSHHVQRQGRMVRYPPRPTEHKYHCHYPWRELFVSLDGTVAPCCGIGRPNLGNLHTDGDLRTLFHHPELARIRSGLVSGDLHSACGSCQKLAMFGGLQYEQASFDDDYHALRGMLREHDRSSNSNGPREARVSGSSPSAIEKPPRDS